MPFKIVRNDITKIQADAIVNTANPEPIYASGTDQAIYEAAGSESLIEERKKIGTIPPGEVAVTPAFHLKARFIIHTVGPEWIDGNHGEFETLSSCYRKSLIIAKQLGCESIAFPLISTGVYGFPKDEALRIALEQIRKFLDDNEMEITLAVFDRRAFVLSSSLVDSVEQFIDENYVEARKAGYTSANRRDQFYGGPKSGLVSPGRRDQDIKAAKSGDASSAGRDRDAEAQKARRESSPKSDKRGIFSRIMQRKARPLPVEEDFEIELSSGSSLDFSVGGAPEFPYEATLPDKPADSALSHLSSSYVEGRSLQDLMKNVGETFQQCLLRLIDERGMSDTDVYKRANLDRKLFSKIRCNAEYKPTKKTALALAIALQLNLDETVDLLGRAGLALSPSSKMDLILEFCIVNQIYDMFKINAMLFHYDQPTLY